MSPKVTQKYKEGVKDRIFDAALRLFERKGYHEASMDEIVQASGLSKGAIYGYFDSKEALFEELQGREITRNLGMLEAELEGLPSARAKLEKVIEYSFWWRREGYARRAKMILEFSAESMRARGVRNRMELRYDRLRRILRPVLEDGVRKGEFRRDLYLEGVISILVAVADGLVMRWSASGGMESSARVKEALVDLVLDGIAAPPGK